MQALLQNVFLSLMARSTIPVMTQKNGKNLINRRRAGKTKSQLEREFNTKYTCRVSKVNTHKTNILCTKLAIS